jgi:hypothetical protein
MHNKGGFQKMKIMKYLLALMILTAGTFSWAGVSTTDISGILPHGGEMYYEAGDNSTNSWVFNWDTTSYHSSTAFFETDGIDKYAVLRCFGNTNITYTGAYVQAGPNLSVHMDMSTVKREELLVTVTFRGSPSLTYGGGTIFGQLQPQVNSAYLGTFTDYRRPGVSRGYLEAVSMKGICIDTTKKDSVLQSFDYGTYMVNTAWTTYTWRIVPTQSNYFILGYIGVVYRADAYEHVNLPFTTDVQIKKIKLQVINYY